MWSEGPQLSDHTGVSVFFDSMKHFLTLALLILLGLGSAEAQRLLIRGDDIGGSHASNVGVITTYTDGIERTAEVMVVGPWFPEAVELLRQHEGLDVGVHIVLTSEWDGYKWRPMTKCPTLCDEYGYFLRGTFPSQAYPEGSMMERSAAISLEEVEAEMRAQIELALRLIPQVSHLSSHMGCTRITPEIAALAQRLAEEYGLPLMDSSGLYEHLPYGMGVPLEEREERFLAALATMEKGKTYMHLDHPAIDSPELRATGHVGYENVAEDRQGVIDLWSSPRVNDYIATHGIELVSFGQLLKENK